MCKVRERTERTSDRATERTSDRATEEQPTISKSYNNELDYPIDVFPLEMDESK